MHRRVLSSLPGSPLPVALPPLTETIKSVSRHCPMSPVGLNLCPHHLVPRTACPAASGETSRVTSTVLLASGPKVIAPDVRNNRNRAATHKSAATMHSLASLSPHCATHCSLHPWRQWPLFLPLSSGPRHGEPWRPCPPAWAGPTLAHGPVLAQGVASWAGAHIGAFSVVAAEGTEQGVEGALVDV